jgi:hypothetical protein
MQPVPRRTPNRQGGMALPPAFFYLKDKFSFEFDELNTVR